MASDGISTPAQYIVFNVLKGSLCEKLRTRPDVLDASDVLDLPPAAAFILEDSMDSLKDLLRSQPNAVLTRDSMGHTPLHWAVILGNAEAIDLLVEAGADLHAVSKDGLSPLCNAVKLKHNSHAICLKILEAGAEANQVIRQKETALTVAAWYSDTFTIGILLDAGANVNGVQGGNPPLTLVSSTTTSEEIEQLLFAGADIDARDLHGETAVMKAIECNNHCVLQTLIYHGAQLVLGTDLYDSVIDLAASWGDLETMRILKEACIEGLPMDEVSLTEYWWWFNARYDALSPYRSRDPPDVEKSAFQALLDSITPAEPVVEQDEDTLLLIPGAFPIDDLEESDCDSRNANGQGEEGNDGLEVKTYRECNDETAVTTDGQDAGDQGIIEDASDDEDDSTIGQVVIT
ncbi:hypothetical protein J4E89_004652 [Alternaria sp. Ai002NY15]|nr:hypothetical protein J4E89_004652 [Alternaria sp. Ai002NY15]